MFDLLKKKISSFVNSLAGKVEEKPLEPPSVLPSPQQAEAAKPLELPQEKASAVEEKPEALPEEKTLAAEQTLQEPELIQAPSKQVPVVESAQKLRLPEPAQKARLPEPVEKPVEKASSPEAQITGAPAAVLQQIPTPPVKERKEIELAPRVGLLKKVTSFFSPEVEIREQEIGPVMADLEVALLESDVSPVTADFLLADLRSSLVGKRVKKGSAGEEIKQVVRASLLKAFEAQYFDFVNYVSAVKAKGEVAIILFVGPNGSGKTTTVAKLAKLLQDNRISTVISASDTFRKAAIEQAVMHGERLGVRVVKQGYGSDPAAVAFDAVAHARAEKIDCVLVDTAGRQETNYNLVREMEKMNRVLKPSLKLFVGEALAGNALLEQVRKFDAAIKLDGLVLTKLDCDAKGGSSLNVVFETKLPILFVGVGQEYGDLRKFEPEWIVDNIFIAG